MASCPATLFASSFAQRSIRWILGVALALGGFFWATPPEVGRSSAAEASAEDAILRAGALLNAAGDNPRQRSLALSEYRSAVRKLLPVLQDQSVIAHAGAEREFFHRHELSEVTPVERSWKKASGLRRNGLGVPVVGRVAARGGDGPECAELRVCSPRHRSGPARLSESVDGVHLGRIGKE